jgi:hypothetical protein
LLVAAVCACATQSAGADDDALRGWYVGISSGGATVERSGFDATQPWNYHGGYRFERVGVEFTYSDLDAFDHEKQPKTDVRVWGVTLAAVPRYDFSSDFALEALLGAHRWQAQARLLGQNFGRDVGVDATYGAGLWWRIKGGLALTIRWQHYNDVSGIDIGQYAMGFTYVFE